MPPQKNKNEKNKTNGNENGNEDEKEKEVLRYNKPGVEIDPDFAQAFTNRPKLSRTPNTENNRLMYEDGEFGN